MRRRRDEKGMATFWLLAWTRNLSLFLSVFLSFFLPFFHRLFRFIFTWAAGMVPDSIRLTIEEHGRHGCQARHGIVGLGLVLYERVREHV